jgi:hypothetical protein
VHVTRLDALINSLAVGAAVGVTGYLSDGLVVGLLLGALGFLVAFAIFDLLTRDGGDRSA